MGITTAATMPWWAKVLGWVVVFLAPIKATMLAVGALIAFDLITGLWAAVKRGDRITSNGIRRTVTKSVAYQMAVITALIMENHFLAGIPVVKIVAGLIAVTEFKSVMENLGHITGLDFWTEILKKMQGQKIIPEPKSQEPQSEAKKLPDNPD